MASDDLKKRIEALNKRPLKNVPNERNAQPESSQNSSHRFSIFEDYKPAPEQDFGPSTSLEETVEGIVTDIQPGLQYYLIDKPARELEAEADAIYRQFVRLTGHPDDEAVIRIKAISKLDRICPQDILFLDLETCGLGLTPVFLVGTMECADDGFMFRQYFARDYSEEAGIVSAISERFRTTKMVVTFNGKTFDMPFLKNRAVATGVYLNQPDSHLDMLYEARRNYRNDLPNCRLQTLEQMVCGRERYGDISSSEIPKAYHEFVRTGNANKLKLILLHNLYDLFTMADLMCRMWGRD